MASNNPESFPFSFFSRLLESLLKCSKYGQSFYKILLIEENENLNASRGNYKAFVTLSKTTLDDIKWWKEEAIKYRRKIDFSTPKHSIITNVSVDGGSDHFELL